MKSIKKIYIQTDTEGVAGYVHYYSASPSSWNYHHIQRMNRLLTGEINAAALACKEFGVQEVLVNDSHGPCYNIIFEELDPICRIIHGRSGHAPSWLPCLDESVDAAIAIGMHAAAGTPQAVCNHSLWHLTDCHHVTHQLSEAAMFSLLCSEKGIPLVALSGDQYICEEILRWVPECCTAEVKMSLGLQFANSLHPASAHALIREKTLAGLAQASSMTKPTVSGPYRLNVSDRDPKEKALPEDLCGDNLWEMVHRSCNTLFAKFGIPEAIDDRTWRYPDSVYQPKS
jgi:D-amino peptidase